MAHSPSGDPPTCLPPRPPIAIHLSSASAATPTSALPPPFLITSTPRVSACPTPTTGAQSPTAFISTGFSSIIDDFLYVGSEADTGNSATFLSQHGEAPFFQHMLCCASNVPPPRWLPQPAAKAPARLDGTESELLSPPTAPSSPPTLPTLPTNFSRVRDDETPPTATKCKDDNITAHSSGGAAAFSRLKHHSPFPSAPALHFTHLFLTDTAKDTIDLVVAPAFAAIDRAREAGERILVYCRMGISRSVSICVAYLMHSLRYTFASALTRVRVARPQADPNINFVVQLIHRSHDPQSDWEFSMSSCLSDGSAINRLRQESHSPNAMFLTPTCIVSSAGNSNDESALEPLFCAKSSQDQGDGSCKVPPSLDQSFLGRSLSDDDDDPTRSSTTPPSVPRASRSLARRGPNTFSASPPMRSSQDE